MNASIDVTLVELDDATYQSAYCPNPKMPLWSAHPRIFLAFGEDGRAKCPYCGTVYRLKDGASAHRH